MKPYVLGIDIGGTNTVFGLVDARGAVIASGSIKTRKHSDFNAYIEELHTAAMQLIEANDAVDKVHGIGIGAPNANYFTGGYVDLAPTRHEQEYLEGLWKYCTTTEEYADRVAEYTHQDRLKDAFVMNLSIGKMIYTKFGALNFNLSVNNLLNNRNIQTGGYQEGKFDYTTYDVSKFPNKYYYAQGIRVFFNFGIRF